MSLWTFAREVDANRQHRLLGCDSFDTIALAINLMAEVDAFVWEEFTERHLSGCGRAAYMLGVPSYLYDLFFNSPVGYRAQYAISPNQGAASNRSLLDTLMNKLVAAAADNPKAKLAELSLKAEQAKVWICEKQVEAHFFDETPEILFSQWGAHCETLVGLRAPVGTQLVVYGGWLDQNGRERINPLKKGRNLQIHQCGFS